MSHTDISLSIERGGVYGFVTADGRTTHEFVAGRRNKFSNLELAYGRGIIVDRYGSVWRGVELLGTVVVIPEVKSMRIMCGESTPDGNVDDPSYAFCGLDRGHGGEHGDWRV